MSSTDEEKEYEEDEEGDKEEEEVEGEEEEKEKHGEEKKKEEVAEEEQKGSREDRDYAFRLGIFQRAVVKLKVRLRGCFNIKEKYFSRWVSTNLSF